MYSQLGAIIWILIRNIILFLKWMQGRWWYIFSHKYPYTCTIRLRLVHTFSFVRYYATHQSLQRKNANCPSMIAFYVFYGETPLPWRENEQRFGTKSPASQVFTLQHLHKLLVTERPCSVSDHYFDRPTRFSVLDMPTFQQIISATLYIS